MTRDSDQKNREPIPEEFESLDAAAEFWDSHDLGDYWDLTSSADLEVRLSRRIFLTPIEPELAKKVTTYARSQGISSETLINVWISEKLMHVTGGK
jgi:hypothetical protein